MRRSTEFAPAALTRRDGAFYWRSGDDARAVIHAVDGEAMEAFAYSPFDIAALAAVTDAPNIQFNVTVGKSSTRRRGKPMSTEIMITLAGQTAEGSVRRVRHALVHPQGQAPLTALGVVMMLERLTELDGKPPPRPASTSLNSWSTQPPISAGWRRSAAHSCRWRMDNEHGSHPADRRHGRAGAQDRRMAFARAIPAFR